MVSVCLFSVPQRSSSQAEENEEGVEVNEADKVLLRCQDRGDCYLHWNHTQRHPGGKSHTHGKADSGEFRNSLNMWKPSPSFIILFTRCGQREDWCRKLTLFTCWWLYVSCVLTVTFSVIIPSTKPWQSLCIWTSVKLLCPMGIGVFKATVWGNSLFALNVVCPLLGARCLILP